MYIIVEPLNSGLFGSMAFVHYSWRCCLFSY